MQVATLISYCDVIKWKHFPRYWPFVRGIHRSPVNSPHKDQWRGALMFSLICTWTNSWANNGDAGDLRCHRTHYGVIVMDFYSGNSRFDVHLPLKHSKHISLNLRSLRTKRIKHYVMMSLCRFTVWNYMPDMFRFIGIWIGRLIWIDCNGCCHGCAIVTSYSGIHSVPVLFLHCYTCSIVNSDATRSVYRKLTHMLCN